jgi:hypothetical protein
VKAVRGEGIGTGARATSADEREPVTPRVMNSLIMVISALIMHQIRWLIKF